MKELKRLRNKYDLTQKEIAKFLGISYSLYVKIENGFKRPSYRVLESLKIYYGEDLDINKLFK